MKRIKSYLSYTTLFILLVAFSNPSVGQTVTYPTNAGVCWKLGSTYTIQWSGFLPGINVKIELYNGSSLYYTIASSTENDGAFSWTVPTSVTIDYDYRIRVSQAFITTISDYSDNYFAIANPAVTYPSNASISWRRGSTYTITWTGFAGTYVKIDLYKSTGIVGTITSSTSNDGSYAYTVPTSLAIDPYYYIRITSTANSGCYDISNSYFAIADPLVIYPSSSGILWRPGTSYNITWSGFPGTAVKIDLYRSGGIYSTIVSSTTNDGSYIWTVPASIPADNYYIRITSTVNSGCIDNSNYYFAIANPQVTYPTAANIGWRLGSTYTITWTGYSGTYVKIDLYRSTGIVGTISSSTENDGSFSWTVPTSLAIGTDYLIRIVSTANTACYDNSNSYFAIADPQVTYPSASGIIWNYGSSYNISWTGFAATNVKIDLYRSASIVGTIISSTPNDGSHPWTVPLLTAASDYYIRITSTANTGVTDISNFYFAIAAYLNVSPTSVSIGSSSGSTGTFTLYSNTTWSITDDAAWLSVSPASGSGNSTITVTSTSENTSPTPRTATVTIAGAGVTPNRTVTVTQAGAAGKTLGNTEVYSLSSTTSNRRAIVVTSAESGTIQSISIYHNGGTGKVLLGVYADVSGSPGGRLGVTNETTINPSAGWQTLALTSPVSITTGQKVWLSWVFENNPGVRYVAGTPARAQSSQSWAGGMPNPFGAATFDNYKYSVYCTYTPGPGPVIKNLGNTTVYTSSSTTANRRAQVVTFPEAGTILSISMYHNGGTGNVLFAVYADAAGSPGARLGITPSTVINASAGWQTVSLITPVVVSSGQNVWLSWVFENNPGVRYIAGTPARAESPQVWAGGMPDPFGTSTLANYKYSLYCTYSTGTGPVSKTLGNTDVYSSSSTTANRRALTVTFPEAGTIQSISIYHNGGTGNLLLGVYADAAGSPGTRLGVTASTVINASAGWQTIPLTSAYSVASGQKVWLAWVFENNPGIRYVTGTPARAESPALWAGGMPDPFGTSTMANYKYSIYCTYTTGGGDEIKDKDESKSVNTPTAINQVFADKEEVLIYPNPTEGEITVTWKNRYSQRLDITIYNILGKAVKQVQTDPDVNEIRLDLNNSSNGIYLFEMKDKKNDLILNRSRIIKK